MAKLAIFTQKKSRENKGTHDLRLHPDKLRARACPRLHIQKPIEGHASFLLDAPEETKVTCTCLGSSEFSTVQRNNTIRHVSSCHITSNSSSVDQTIPPLLLIIVRHHTGALPYKQGRSCINNKQLKSVPPNLSPCRSSCSRTSSTIDSWGFSQLQPHASIIGTD